MDWIWVCSVEKDRNIYFKSVIWKIHLATLWHSFPKCKLMKLTERGFGNPHFPRHKVLTADWQLLSWALDKGLIKLCGPTFYYVGSFFVFAMSLLLYKFPSILFQHVWFSKSLPLLVYSILDRISYTKEEHMEECIRDEVISMGKLTVAACCSLSTFGDVYVKKIKDHGRKCV